MSEDRDRDYKPKQHSYRHLQQTSTDRPRRATRKELDYKESPILVESDEETKESTAEGAVESGVDTRGTTSLRGRNLERTWSEVSSEISVKTECWSPGRVERRTEGLIQGIQDLKFQFGQERMAKQDEASMGLILKLMLEMNAKQDADRIEREHRLAEEARIREEKREERAEKREQERKVQAEAREHKMIMALKETRPVIESAKLPNMEKGTDIESFLELFETALTVAQIPENKWLPRLHAALDTDTKLLVREVFTNPDASYTDAKLALTGQTHMSFSAASEAMMTLDDGKVMKMPIRQGAQRVANFLKKACDSAPTWGETHLYGAVAIIRYFMQSEVKTYLDLKGITKPEEYFRATEEWQRMHPGRSVWDHKVRGSAERSGYKGMGSPNRKQEVFFLWKAGALCP